jgi:hypothetical protein
VTVIPPVIKKVVRNGRTLVYRIPESNVPSESTSEPKSQPVKPKKLIRRVTGDSTSSTYPYMIDSDHQLEREGNKFIITFLSQSYYCDRT